MKTRHIIAIGALALAALGGATAGVLALTTAHKAAPAPAAATPAAPAPASAADTGVLFAAQSWYNGAGPVGLAIVNYQDGNTTDADLASSLTTFEDQLADIQWPAGVSGDYSTLSADLTTASNDGFDGYDASLSSDITTVDSDIQTVSSDFADLYNIIWPANIAGGTVTQGNAD